MKEKLTFVGSVIKDHPMGFIYAVVAFMWLAAFLGASAYPDLYWVNLVLCAVIAVVGAIHFLIWFFFIRRRRREGNAS